MNLPMATSSSALEAAFISLARTPPVRPGNVALEWRRRSHYSSRQAGRSPIRRCPAEKANPPDGGLSRDHAAMAFVQREAVASDARRVALMLYFDTSFLVPLVRDEATSVKVERFMARQPAGELA